MAYPDFKIDIAGMQKRLKSVLIYDAVAENKIDFHLASVLNISRPVARRMLFSECRTIINRCLDAADALDISSDWLIRGDLMGSNNRTKRIHIQAYKGYPKEITDKAMKFLFANIAGHRKATNLMNMVTANQISYVEALHIF